MKQRVGFQFHALGGTNEVQLWAESEAQLQAVARQAVAEVSRIQDKYSRYQDDSVITRINRAAGKHAVQIDEETQHLLRFADRVYQQSQGLFDITSGVLRRAWDFKKQELPSHEILESLRPLIGWNQVQVDATSIFLPVEGMQIDFGGIGKEYAADRVAGILKKEGIQHALVNLGGDVHVVGPHLDGRPWRIGITHPRKLGEAVRFVEMFEGCLATSGDYERYFELDGQRYCHILHPHRMSPVQDFQSVSIMADSCLLAGGLATSAMLLGEDGAVDLLESTDLPYFIVRADGSFYSGTGREGSRNTEAKRDSSSPSLLGSV